MQFKDTGKASPVEKGKKKASTPVPTPPQQAQDDESLEEEFSWSDKEDKDDDREVYVVLRGFETGPCGKAMTLERIAGFSSAAALVKKKVDKFAARGSYQHAIQRGQVYALGKGSIADHEHYLARIRAQQSPPPSQLKTPVQTRHATPLASNQVASVSQTLQSFHLSPSAPSTTPNQAHAASSQHVQAGSMLPSQSSSSQGQHGTLPTPATPSFVYHQGPSTLSATASTMSPKVSPLARIANLSVIPGVCRLTSPPPMPWTPSAGTNNPSFHPDNLPADAPPAARPRCQAWYVLVKGTAPGIFKDWEDIVLRKNGGYCFGFNTYADALASYLQLHAKNQLETCLIA
ncbi:hypothetical protein OF83DRAFT_1169013 [Amylostereum chailletii]|nr:hypothetical protein OF83DRAFT_1169013 [Amylostereum chailletii]